MCVSLPIQCSNRDRSRGFEARSSVIDADAIIRAAALPSNLLLATAIIFGWMSLSAWTGVGPQGWQARSCAESDFGLGACSAARLGKDQSRIVPHILGSTS